MNALPILLLGGAALVMMGGGKKTTTTGAPKKKAAPSYGKDSSSMISIYQDGSVRLGRGWESAYLKPKLGSMWGTDFEEIIDVSGTFWETDGWGYDADLFTIDFTEADLVVDYKPDGPFYNKALEQLFNSITVNYHGQNKRLSEFSDAYPHVKSLRNDIRWMFKKWTEAKIRSYIPTIRRDCEARGM